MQVKIHNSYRTVVAVCDSELVGKKFEEGIKQLDIAERFYKGEELNEEETIKVMQIQSREDATFNIVGEKAIEAAIKAGIISSESVAKINNIPYTLKLL